MIECIQVISSQFEKLSDIEKNSITTMLSTHFGRTIDFSITGLSILDQKEIQIISSTMNGLFLTKEKVPDFIEQFASLKVTDLPQKISFGRIKDSEN